MRYAAVVLRHCAFCSAVRFVHGLHTPKTKRKNHCKRLPGTNL